MQNYILFFDIDGTLLNGEGKVPDSTKEAIRQLKKRGHLCFVCTGRAKSMMPKEITDLAFDGYVYGGGTMVEYETHKIASSELSKETLDKVAGILNNYHVSFIFEGETNIYLEEPSLEDKRPFFQAFVKSLGPIAKVITNHEEVSASKITMLLPDNMEQDAFQGMLVLLQEDFDVVVHEEQGDSVLTSGLIELLPKGINKAYGIQKTIEAIKIPWENTIGVGDSNNDLEMFAYVKTSICMGNGSTKAKEIADIITNSIDEDGIYYAMKQLDLIEANE